MIDSKALARWLSVKPQTVEKWRWLEKGPPYYRLASGDVRYCVDEVEAWLASRRVVPKKRRVRWKWKRPKRKRRPFTRRQVLRASKLVL